jgi:hypothetical protein
MKNLIGDTIEDRLDENLKITYDSYMN